MNNNLLKTYEAYKPFSDSEAWWLFRAAAISESVGWTLLIFGVLFKHYVTPGNDIPVLLAGRVHGTLFLLYILAALGLYPSLNWSRKRAIIAAIASVPPYGSLMFEQWAAYKRRRANISQSTLLCAYAVLVDMPVK